MKLTKETMSALLARPLSSYEDTNYDTYLKIARQNMDTLLCMNLCDDEPTKVFEANEGYSTVWTDIFTEIEEVTIDSDVVTNYSVRQGDRRTGSWYNSIVFDTRFTCNEEVSVTASWGFQNTPLDLQDLLAGLFGLISKKASHDGTIYSKRVEDFEVRFNADTDVDEDFYSKNSATIAKYSLCEKQGIRHGRVRVC